jgi:hypothetical protein
MFIVDVSLKNAPVTLSVQRKSLEDAQAVYQQVLDAIQSGNPITLELTCETQSEKKVALLVSEIAAVQVFEKSGTSASSGRPPGFFALAQ